MLSLEALETKLDSLIGRTSDTPRWLTIDAAESYSGLSGPSIRRLIRRGTLTAYRPIPGRVLIDRRQFDTVILSATAPPTAGRGKRRPDGGAARGGCCTY